MATIAEAFGRKWTIGILSHAVAVYVIDLLVSDMCSCCILSHAVIVAAGDPSQLRDAGQACCDADSARNQQPGDQHRAPPAFPLGDPSGQIPADDQTGWHSRLDTDCTHLAPSPSLHLHARSSGRG